MSGYDAIQLVGWVGAALLLLAYGLLTAGRLSATGSTYLVINFGASIALGASTAVAHAWPSTTVNALWLVIGILPLIHALRRRRSGRLARASAERGGQVSEQVGDILDADREPHQVVANAQR